MKKFDTKVQHLKYKVLKHVAKFAWEGNLEENIANIPKMIVTKKEPTMRCCIYKEQAIVLERVKLAMGGNKNSKNVIEVIDIACDECPMSGYEVTDYCRGCLSHRCEDVCKKGAITFDSQLKAHIDKTKCVDCGLCAKVCPYGAIRNHKRPCEIACKVKAISSGADHTAVINDEKCISCGACVYQCPWGAISDKSYILDVIDIIKNSNNNTNYKVHAVVAPAISSQFVYAKLGQVIKGIKELGFADVTEAALGADMVALLEAEELSQKGFLTSSCCPAFVSYVQKQFPDLKEYVSHTLSPFATISKKIKEKDPTSKIVFIGPCTAKKMEFKKEDVAPFVDSVITFEELQALFDSREIDVSSLQEEELENASYYGRIFARNCGLSEAVAEGLKEKGIKNFDLKAVSCDGIEACRVALLKAQKRILDGNFIEGMACLGGCMGGAGCLTHGERSKFEVDKHGKQSKKEDIKTAVKEFGDI